MGVISKVDPGFLKLDWRSSACRLGIYPGKLCDA